MINYTLNVEKDIYSLEVLQDSTYKLLYISSNLEEEIITTTSITANTVVNFSLNKDGEYILILNSNGEEELTKSIFYTQNLIEGIVESTLDLLCGECTECLDKSSQLSYKEEVLLSNRNIFNKLLIYQNVYLPHYGEDYLAIFSRFLEKASLLSKCNIQEDINKAYTEKIVSGKESFNEKIFNSQIFIYWAGMYFSEKKLINNSDTEEVEYLKDKFYTESILNCGCELCFTFDELETVFNETANAMEIYSFQFDNISYSINNIENKNYNLEEQVIENLEGGIYLSFNKVGRVGFLIKNLQENPYIIKDSLDRDITSTFDYTYLNNNSYYVSKEYYVPTEIYFKFVKTL